MGTIHWEGHWRTQNIAVSSNFLSWPIHRLTVKSVKSYLSNQIIRSSCLTTFNSHARCSSKKIKLECLALASIFTLVYHSSVWVKTTHWEGHWRTQNIAVSLTLLGWPIQRLTVKSVKSYLSNQIIRSSCLTTFYFHARCCSKKIKLECLALASIFTLVYHSSVWVKTTHWEGHWRTQNIAVSSTLLSWPIHRLTFKTVKSHLSNQSIWSSCFKIFHSHKWCFKQNKLACLPLVSISLKFMIEGKNYPLRGALKDQCHFIDFLELAYSSTPH